MLPMRIKIRFLAILHNLLSYSIQFLQGLCSVSIDIVLDLFTDILESLYTFFYSHREAHRRRVEDRKERTSYIRDGYGKRYKIVSPRTKNFYACNYRPLLRYRSK